MKFIGSKIRDDMRKAREEREAREREAQENRTPEAEAADLVTGERQNAKRVLNKTDETERK